MFGSQLFREASAGNAQSFQEVGTLGDRNTQSLFLVPWSSGCDVFASADAPGSVFPFPQFLQMPSANPGRDVSTLLHVTFATVYAGASSYIGRSSSSTSPATLRDGPATGGSLSSVGRGTMVTGASLESFKLFFATVNCIVIFRLYTRESFGCLKELAWFRRGFVTTHVE